MAEDDSAAEATGLPDFDTHAVLAKLRSGDADVINMAYRQTFSGEQGRLVLAHLAAEAGVGRRYGAQGDPFSCGYHAGGHDVALDIMERAGFDPHSAALMVLTGRLEGRDDERTSHSEYAEPEPEFGD